MAALLSFARGAALAAMLLALAAPVAARPFDGFVTHVSDGDSLWVRPAAGGAALEIRLQGIDAPELCQPYGRQARAALAARALNRLVRVHGRARDRYERLLARVAVGQQDLGRWMVAQGHAWSDGSRGSGGPYAGEQAQARSARLGLWNEAEPLRPREFRQQQGSCF